MTYEWQREALPAAEGGAKRRPTSKTWLYITRAFSYNVMCSVQAQWSSARVDGKLRRASYQTPGA